MLSPLGIRYCFVYTDLTSFVSHVCIIVTLAFHWIEPKQQHVTYNAIAE